MSRSFPLIALAIALPPAWAGPPPDLDGAPLPAGAVRRFGQNPYHSLYHRNAEFTADGTEIVVLRWGVYVSVYDRDTGRLKESRTLPVEPVEQYQLLPGGQKALLVHSAGPDRWRPVRYDVWDVRAGHRLGRVAADPGGPRIEWVTPTPDGHFLIATEESGSTGGELRWRLSKREVRTGLEVKSVAAAVKVSPTGYGWGPPQISPDGRFLVQTIYPNGDAPEIQCVCWEADGLTECWRCDFPRSAGHLDFVRAGEAVLLGKPPTGLDLKTGRPTTTRFPPSPTSYSSYVPGPDPNVLFYPEAASATGGARVRAWDLKAGAPVPGGPEIRLAMPGTTAFCLSPDGRYVLDFTGTQVFDRTTGRALWPALPPDRHQTQVQALAFSADGRRLASAGWYEQRARVWDVTTGRCLGDWPAGPGSRTLEWLGPHQAHNGKGPPPIALSADGRRLVVGSLLAAHGVTGPRVYDVDSGELLAAAPVPQTRNANAVSPLLGAVTFLPGDDAVVATFDTGVDQVADWTVARWEYARAAWHVGGRVALGQGSGGAIDGAGSLVAGGKVFPSGTATAAYELVGGGGPVAGSANGRFATGAGDPDPAPRPLGSGLTIWRDFRLWDARTGTVIAKVPRLPDPLPDRLRGLDDYWIWPRLFAVHPTGRYLVLADAGGVRLWDAALGRVAHRFPVPTLPALEWNSGSPVTALAFSPDGSRLATGLPDGTILLWEVPAPSPISLPAETADRLWAELMGDDSPTGWRAAWLLGDDPVAAVRLARKHVAAVKPFPVGELGKLLVDVESPRFAVREQATARLERSADLIGSAVAEVLKATKSEETRVRLEKVMAAVPGPERPLPAWASALGRGVSVVEHAGGDEARLLLTTWAGGAPDAFLTKEAKAALGRLAATR